MAKPDYQMAFYFSLFLSCLLKADTIPNRIYSADGTVICGQITEIAAS